MSKRKEYFSVFECTEEELRQLKIEYYTCQGIRDISYLEMATIDDLVSDETVQDEYSGCIFTDSDFYCNAS